jgi:hypothetical protein
MYAWATGCGGHVRRAVWKHLDDACCETHVLPSIISPMALEPGVLIVPAAAANKDTIVTVTVTVALNVAVIFAILVDVLFGIKTVVKMFILAQVSSQYSRSQPHRS